MMLTDAQVQEIAARITEQPLFVLGCHCHGQTAALLADHQAMRRVVEAAQTRVQSGHDVQCQSQYANELLACNCGQDAFVNALAALDAEARPTPQEAP